MYILNLLHKIWLILLINTSSSSSSSSSSERLGSGGASHRPRSSGTSTSYCKPSSCRLAVGRGCKVPFLADGGYNGANYLFSSTVFCTIKHTLFLQRLTTAILWWLNELLLLGRRCEKFIGGGVCVCSNHETERVTASRQRLRLPLLHSTCTEYCNHLFWIRQNSPWEERNRKRIMKHKKIKHRNTNTSISDTDYGQLQ